MMSNRARVEGGVGTYTIAPKSNVGSVGGIGAKPMGHGSEDAFRRLKMRQSGKGSGR
jgi:transcription factor SPN1